MKLIRRVARGGCVVVILAALGCSDDDDDGLTGIDASITLGVTPNALTVAAGESGNATINIERLEFSGGVTLALVNPPAGITGAFTPSPSTTSASTLAVSVSTNVLPGNRALTITGTAAGVPDHTVLLPLTVVAKPTAGTIEYLYCDPAQAPVFFAYQDGTTAWQAVTSSASGGAVRYAFNLTSGRGGVTAVFRSSASAAVAARRPASALSAIRFTPGRAPRQRQPVVRQSNTSRLTTAVDVYRTEVLYGSATELAQDGALNCAETLPTKTVKGTVAGVAAGQYGIVSLGSVTEIFEGGGVSTNPVTFEGVQGGLVDFAGTRLTPGTVANKAVLFRDLNIADGGSLPAPIDFNGTASFVPATATVNVTGAPGDNLEVYTTVLTATGDVLFWNDVGSSQVANRPWAGLSAANLRAGEFHSVIVFAYPVGGSEDFRVALKYRGQVANETIALGSIVALPTVSLVTGGSYPRYRFQGTVPPEYNRGLSLALDSDNAGNSFSVVATTTYLTAAGSAQAYDLTMPNVSALPGFPVAARLTSGTNSVLIDAYSFTGLGVFDPRPALGGEFKASDRFSTIVVP